MLTCKLSLEERYQSFVKKATKNWNGLYQYDEKTKESYHSLSSKVAVKCKKHGYFYTYASNHVKGKRGCPKCYDEKSKVTYVLSADEFYKRVYTAFYGNPPLSKERAVKEYKTLDTVFKFNCDKHGVYEVKAKNLIRGFGCKECAHERFLNKCLSELIKKSKKIHGDKYDYSHCHETYVGKCPKVKLICNTCGNEFYIDFDHHIHRKQGCKKCGDKRAIEVNRRSIEYYKGRIYAFHKNDIFCDDILSRFVKGNNACDKEEVKCNICGYKWKTSLSSLSNGHGCPNCNSSKGESAISFILTEMGLKFEREKTFPDLISDKNGKLRYDFYVESKNLLIEFDGIQHYEDNGKFLTHEQFIAMQERDRIKNEYALKNGVKLMRIKYNRLSQLMHIIDKIILKKQRQGKPLISIQIPKLEDDHA